MKRERVRCDTNRACDFTGGHAIRAGLDQRTVDLKPMLLRECRQSCYSSQLIHTSTTIEMIYARQVRNARMRKTTTQEVLPCA